MLEAAPKAKLRDVVASRLKSFIRDENLKPGDRLPTEGELAARFGVSRLSLREATKSLEFIGLVQSKPGRGMSVGSVRIERFTEYLGFHSSFHGATPCELIDTRVIVELGALRQAAERIKADPTVYKSLHLINSDLRRATTLQRWVELDIAFHRGLIAASGLAPLLAFGDVLSLFFQRFRESVKRGEWREGVASHQKIIDSLRKGRVEAAEAELREHIESHRGRLETTR